MLGCPSTVAGDAGVANFGVARRARPVEGAGFAGLGVGPSPARAGGGLEDRRFRGGLNGAPAGRFLDVSGWVGVLFLVGVELGYGFRG